MPKQRREWKLYNEDIERTFTQHQTQITQLDSSITLQASTKVTPFAKNDPNMSAFETALRDVLLACR